MSTNSDSTTSVEDMNRGPLKTAIEGEVIASDVGGAPSKYTPHVVGKLVVAFNNDYTITQACIYAGIDRTTYYDWIDNKPGFSNKMEEAKSVVLRRAREVIIDAINNGDANLAFKLLQARDPEYKNKLSVEPGKGIEETREKIKEFLNEPTSYDGSAGQPDAAGSEPTAAVADAGTDEVAPAPADIS